MPYSLILAQQNSKTQVKSLSIKILSTMLAEDGIGEWGFSALVDVDGRQFLFDAGRYPETVLKNARAGPVPRGRRSHARSARRRIPGCPG